MTDAWDAFLAGAGDPNSMPAEASVGMPDVAYPALQGATWGLAGNLGLLPKDYAKRRAANPAIYGLGETAGELGSSMLLPELSLPADIGRAGAFAGRLGYNALMGAGMGAASTNVSGGDVTSNAEGGAIGAAALAPLVSVASALAPRVSPAVAKALQNYTDLFGKEPKTRQEMLDAVDTMSANVAKTVGGINLKTKLPPTSMFPAPQFQQNLAQRLTWLNRADFTGVAGNQADAVRNTITTIADTANANGGVLPPDVYIRLTQDGGEVAKLASSKTPSIQRAGSEIRSALDDAMRVQSPEDADTIDAMHSAHQLWRIADAYATGGKQSAARLTQLVNKHYNTTGSLAVTGDELAKGAVSTPHPLLHRFAEGGLLLGAGDVLGEHVLNPLIEHVAGAGAPGLLTTAAGTGTLAALGLAGAAARRSGPMVQAGLARALGKANPLLLDMGTPVVASGALAGAAMAPGQTGAASPDSWDEFLSQK